MVSIFIIVMECYVVLRFWGSGKKKGLGLDLIFPSSLSLSVLTFRLNK